MIKMPKSKNDYIKSFSQQAKEGNRIGCAIIAALIVVAAIKIMFGW
jgi:hypothetical protein